MMAAADDTPAVEVEGLVKTYKEVVAVDGISVRIEPGEMFGMLGPNGAGKTTTLGILSTLRRPTAGAARVWGYDVTRQRAEVRRRIGIVFQEFSLDDKLTGRENLDFHGRLYGMGRALRRERIAEVLELVDLVDRADSQVEKYSGGMKRRLEIARGLLHAPPLLFLDEPTLGLDAQTRRQIWKYLAELNERVGVTVILTTHYMEEADVLCERVAIVDHGRIVACDSPDALKASLGGDAVHLGVAGDDDAIQAALLALPFVSVVTGGGGSLSLTLDRADERVSGLVDAVRGAGGQLTSLNLRRPTLEDVFLHYTGRGMRDGDEGDAFAISRAQRRR
jgi:ABC-2 type transport system ATP-binding protein